MQGTNLVELERLVSPERLSSYACLTGTTDTSSLLRAYLWNKRLSSALFPVLQCLEVSLRNSIHSAACTHFRNQNWFDQLTRYHGDAQFRKELAHPSTGVSFGNDWYRRGVSKGRRQNRKVWKSRHEMMLERAKRQLQKAGKASTPGAIIAELTFGFWTKLFERGYFDPTDQRLPWPHIEHLVFPTLTPVERRFSSVHPKLLTLNQLRNRLSHHEPVWKDSSVHDAQTAMAFLDDFIDQTVDLLRGISRERYNVLLRSGQLSLLQGLATQRALDHYLYGDFGEQFDKRKLKRNLARCVNHPQVGEFIVTSKGSPILIASLCTP